jgi:hypothetical protein
MEWAEDGGKLLVGAPGGRRGGKVFEWKRDGGELTELEIVGEDGARVGEKVKYGLGGKKVVVNAPRASLGSENRPDEEEFGGIIVVDA